MKVCRSVLSHSHSRRITAPQDFLSTVSRQDFSPTIPRQLLSLTGVFA